MQRMLGITLLAASACVSASDVYDASSGTVQMPNVQVGSERFEVRLQHQGNLVFSVASATRIEFPDRFSMEWLSGRTLYGVFFDTDDDVNQTSVFRLVFQADGTVLVTSLLGRPQPPSLGYAVDQNGHLHFSGDPSGTEMICGSTSEYVISNYYIDGVYEDSAAWFFNEEDAMNAARLLSGPIPPCS